MNSYNLFRPLNIIISVSYIRVCFLRLYFEYFGIVFRRVRHPKEDTPLQVPQKEKLGTDFS